MARPVASRPPKGGGGVQLSEYKIREFDSLLTAGRTGSRGHRAMQSAIQKERGGVLPSNWEVALAIKQNVEAMEGAMKLGKDSPWRRASQQLGGGASPQAKRAGHAGHGGRDEPEQGQT